jgi:hypothetical protein
VSEWRQPWKRADLDGRRCHLQILDPATAFELEPVLAAALGDAASLAIVAPRELAAAALRAGGLDKRRTLADLAADPAGGAERAARVVRTAGAIVSRALLGLDLSPALLCELHERCVLGRLRVEGELVEDVRDWSALALHPSARWQALAVQIRQTFGPLWTRSPYKLRCPKVADGVPEPTAVPVAIRYAATIAERGYASSTHEVLTQWTPVRMIEVVEAAAYDAARRNAAYEQARAEGSR